MTRTYTTSQVLRHLERQHSLIFDAPGARVAAVSDQSGTHLRVWLDTVCSWTNVAPPLRSDWVLVSGTIRKPTRRRIRLGTIDLTDTTKGTPDLTKPRTVALSDDVAEALRKVGRRWKLVAVEVEEKSE